MDGTEIKTCLPPEAEQHFPPTTTHHHEILDEFPLSILL